RTIGGTSPSLALAAAALRILRSFLPLLILWISKAIIDDLIGIMAGKRHDGHIWKLVALELCLAIVADALGRCSGFVEGFLSEDLTHRLSIRLMAHATVLDLAVFESPDYLDKLERGRRQASGTMTMLPP